MTHLTTTLTEGVLHAVINRPERKNALTGAIYQSLCDMLDTARQDPATRVVLLCGAGGVFTAGNDLDDFVENPPRDLDASVFQFMLKLAAFPKPVVAAVEGLAIGIGTTMLLHCDLVYAAQDTRFSLPFVNLGLVPEAGSSLLLARASSHPRAAEKLLLGDVFNCQEAEALGLLTRALPAADVLPTASAQAARLARLPAGSVAGSKALMKRVDAEGVQGHIRTEAQAFIARVSGPALKEAVAAFKAKRKPDFTGMD